MFLVIELLLSLEDVSCYLLAETDIENDKACFFLLQMLMEIRM